MKLKVIFALLSFLSAIGYADTFSGRVVSVADGDTVTVLTAENHQERVRLGAIDAPEKGQAFGQVSKQAMSDLVFNKQVDVDWYKRDRYHRIVGTVRINGLDVGLQQVKSGLAWHYKKYAFEQTVADRAEYEAEENSARSARRGLWIDPEPVPPWDWRKSK